MTVILEDIERNQALSIWDIAETMYDSIVITGQVRRRKEKL